MKVLDWLNDIIYSGLLCEEYTKKVKEAHGKRALFDIVCDSNGISFIPEMMSKGKVLSYSDIKSEFGNYINGRCKPKIEYIDGDRVCWYTSALYCDCSDDRIDVDTTLACFLGCCNDVYLKENSYTRLYVDTNSVLTINVPTYCKCVVYCYGNASVIVRGESGNLRVVKKD